MGEPADAMRAACSPSPETDVIRVGIVDDEPIVRRALRYLLEEQGLQVVGEAASGREAIDLVRTCAIDVLLLDLEMPSQGGMDALATIKANSKRARLAVLILSSHPEQPFAIPLLRNGASGYLSKSREPSEIARAVRHVAQGRRFITPPVAELLADEVLAPADAAQDRLSLRELQLLAKLARGRTAKQVATELSLSPATVGNYRMRLMRKLHARSESDLAYYAFKHRVVD